ncbi:hypothetical protein [Streptomyces yerevanensis]|uniref:hypothetical protein n=1 Tax=Streptomyces yerevanensis TaxID=66378 RepID=UPI0012FF4A42|nr:hypothetical protein [Streptomyces yerevanensis]
MQWTPLVAALVGAVIAMTSTVVAEARKDRRETQGEWRRIKHELYGGYLATLAQVRSELQLIILDRDMPDTERPAAALRTFARCYELRYQLEVLAPSAVVEPALTYFRAVRSLRDAAAAGADSQAEGMEDLFDDVLSTLAEVRNAMRKDMGTDAWAAATRRVG